MFRPAGNTEQGYWAVLKKNIQKDWGVAVNIPTSWQPWARLLGGAEYSERVGGVVNILGQLATLGKVTGRGRRRIFRKSGRGGKYPPMLLHELTIYKASRTEAVFLVGETASLFPQNLFECIQIALLHI
jgi:hypothetical protein